jgi:hypothetical protein
LLHLQQSAGNRVVNAILRSAEPPMSLKGPAGNPLDGPRGTAPPDEGRPDEGRPDEGRAATAATDTAVASDSASSPQTPPRARRADGAPGSRAATPGSLSSGLVSLPGVRATSVVGALRSTPLKGPSQVVRRRVPDMSELRQLVKTEWRLDISTMDYSEKVSSPLADTHAEGLRTVLRRQLADLRKQFGPETNTMKTLEKSVPGKTIDNAVATGTALDLLRLAEGILKQNEASKLLAPEGYMAPPANSVEQGNVRKLVLNAGAIFDLVAAGAKDAVINEIFGATEVVAAKAKMALAKAKMLDLYNTSKIVTDRSGYSGEVLLGGMSMYNVNILMPSGAIDNPDHGHSIATMFHEAMHAGNSDVKDNGGYVGSPSFKLQPDPLKIVNAAHFEVIALRHLLGPNPAWDGAFRPPGAAIDGSGAVVPGLTATEKALRRVSETFRRSWTASLWVRDEFLNVYKDRTLWSKPWRGGPHAYSAILSYWSPILGLTIDKRLGTVDPMSADRAKSPVSQIDLALIEGVAKRFAYLGVAVPKTEAEAYKNKAVYPDGTNWAYVFNPEVEADALAADLLATAGLLENPVRDKAAVDALCNYFSIATGTPALSGQHQPSGYPK